MDKENKDVADTGGMPLMGDAGQPQEVLGQVVAEKKGKSNVSRLLGLTIVVGVIVLLAGVLLLYQKVKKRNEVEAPSAKLELPKFAKKNDAVESDFINGKKREIEKHDEALARARIEEEEAQARRKAAALDAAGVGGGNAAPTPSGSYGKTQGGYSQEACPAGGCPQTPNERKLQGDVAVALQGEGANGVGGSGNSQFPESLPPNNRWKPNGLPENYPSRPTMPNFNGVMPVNNQVAEDTSIGVKLKPTVAQARYAGNLSNMDYLLKKGTVIPCSLKTGIDTTLPSLVICTATNDVYSANGKTQLITRGATIHGEQQSSLQLGQARVFCLWSRIDNPDGTYAELDSPAADAMGFGGIGGYVDTHFADRFGAAILVSIIKDASQFALSNLAKNQNQQAVPSNTMNAGSTMAQEVLRSTVNIPPTLIVNPATRVNVIVARDVSFESVYKVIE